MCIFENGHKKEAPSLFCFGMSHQALPTAQCSDGALIYFEDVYKRQGGHDAVKLGVLREIVLEGNDGRAVEAVSYTHLVVRS